MPRSDDLVDIVKFRLAEKHKRELERLGGLDTPWGIRRRGWLKNQIQKLQFELGQYRLVPGVHDAG